MHMGFKISLSNWIMGRSPLMEFPFMNLEDKILLEGEGNVITRMGSLDVGIDEFISSRVGLVY